MPDKISSDLGTGSTVLEVATGTGLVALKIANVAGQIHAIDISPQMIAVARKKAEERKPPCRSLFWGC